MTIKIASPTPSPVPHKTSAAKQPTAQPEHKMNQPSDSVTMTERATQLQKLETLIRDYPVVDSHRVDKMTSAVNSGRYEINPAQVARKLISLESSLNQVRA